MSEMSRSKAFAQTCLMVLVLLIVVLAPFWIAGLFWSNVFVASIPGLFAATLGAALGGFRHGVRLGAFLAALTALGIMAHPWPLAGALVMAVAAILPAVDARKGLHNASVVVPIQLGFVVVAPPALAAGMGSSPSHVSGAIVTAIVVLAGGLWGAACAWYLMRNKPRPKAEGLSREISVIYGLVLAVSLGVSTWAVLKWDSGGYGAWVMLTIGLMLRPSMHETWQRSRHRVGGTLLGLATSGLLVTLVTDAQAQGILALLFMVVAGATMILGKPYWVFVTFLTPGIILSTVAGKPATGAEEQRLLFTLVGVVAAILMVLLGAAVMRLRHPELRIKKSPG